MGGGYHDFDSMTILLGPGLLSFALVGFVSCLIKLVFFFGTFVSFLVDLSCLYLFCLALI